MQNGGFETAFPNVSVEDQELSFRLAEKGYPLVFTPFAAVYHAHDSSASEYARRKLNIGYWKAYLLRWHPEKALTDTHTAPSQRFQILALAIVICGVFLSYWWQPGLWMSGLALVAFYLSAIPFLFLISRRDPAVLAVAPGLLLVRAAMLGGGLAAGLVALRRRFAPRRPALSWLERVLKRTMDLFGASSALLLSLPAACLIALAIKLDSLGPVFFVQERVGENGRMFRMIKFRSMVIGAENSFAQAAAVSPLPAAVVKVPGDPRTTRVGQVLRRWSLDELPQFWNVLRGEMSLVGPRPEESSIVARYDDWHRRRLALKPGLTGPMQVNGRGDLPLDRRLQLELEYIEHYSLWIDLILLARTIPAVISGRGAY